MNMKNSNKPSQLTSEQLWEMNEGARARLQLEINQYPVSIDRSVFVKTPAERSILKSAKAQYKLMVNKS